MYKCMVPTIHRLHSHMSMLLGPKVNKSIVLDLLYSLNRSVDRKSLFYLSLTSSEHKVTNIENLHLYMERERSSLLKDSAVCWELSN